MRDFKDYERRRNILAWKSTKETAFVVGTIVGVFIGGVILIIAWGLV